MKAHCALFNILWLKICPVSERCVPEGFGGKEDRVGWDLPDKHDLGPTRWGLLLPTLTRAGPLEGRLPALWIFTLGPPRSEDLH